MIEFCDYGVKLVLVQLSVGNNPNICEYSNYQVITLKIKNPSNRIQEANIRRNRGTSLQKLMTYQWPFWLFFYQAAHLALELDGFIPCFSLGSEEYVSVYVYQTKKSHWVHLNPMLTCWLRPCCMGFLLKFAKQPKPSSS